MNLYNTLPISSSQYSFSTALIFNGSQLQLGASGFMLKLNMVRRRRKITKNQNKQKNPHQNLEALKCVSKCSCRKMKALIKKKVFYQP